MTWKEAGEIDAVHALCTFLLYGPGSAAEEAAAREGLVVLAKSAGLTAHLTGERIKRLWPLGKSWLSKKEK